MNCSSTHKLQIKTLGSQTTRTWVRLSDGAVETDPLVLAELESTLTDPMCEGKPEIVSAYVPPSTAVVALGTANDDGFVGGWEKIGQIPDQIPNPLVGQTWEPPFQIANNVTGPVTLGTVQTVWAETLLPGQPWGYFRRQFVTGQDYDMEWSVWGDNYTGRIWINGKLVWDVPDTSPVVEWIPVQQTFLPAGFQEIIIEVQEHNVNNTRAAFDSELTPATEPVDIAALHAVNQAPDCNAEVLCRGGKYFTLDGLVPLERGVDFYLCVEPEPVTKPDIVSVYMPPSTDIVTMAHDINDGFDGAWEKIGQVADQIPNPLVGQTWDPIPLFYGPIVGQVTGDQVSDLRSDNNITGTSFAYFRRQFATPQAYTMVWAVLADNYMRRIWLDGVMVWDDDETLGTLEWIPNQTNKLDCGLHEIVIEIEEAATFATRAYFDSEFTPIDEPLDIDALHALNKAPPCNASVLCRDDEYFTLDGLTALHEGSDFYLCKQCCDVDKAQAVKAYIPPPVSDEVLEMGQFFFPEPYPGDWDAIWHVTPQIADPISSTAWAPPLVVQNNSTGPITGNRLMLFADTPVVVGNVWSYIRRQFTTVGSYTMEWTAFADNFMRRIWIDGVMVYNGTVTTGSPAFIPNQSIVLPDGPHEIIIEVEESSANTRIAFDARMTPFAGLDVAALLAEGKLPPCNGSVLCIDDKYFSADGVDLLQRDVDFYLCDDCCGDPQVIGWVELSLPPPDEFSPLNLDGLPFLDRTVMPGITLTTEVDSSASANSTADGNSDGRYQVVMRSANRLYTDFIFCEPVDIEISHVEGLGTIWGTGDNTIIDSGAPITFSEPDNVTQYYDGTNWLPVDGLTLDSPVNIRNSIGATYPAGYSFVATTTTSHLNWAHSASSRPNAAAWIISARAARPLKLVAPSLQHLGCGGAEPYIETGEPHYWENGQLVPYEGSDKLTLNQCMTGCNDDRRDDLLDQLVNTTASTNPTAAQIADAIVVAERTRVVGKVAKFAGTNTEQLPVTAGQLGTLVAIEDSSSGLVYFTLDGTTPTNGQGANRGEVSGLYHSGYHLRNVDLSLVRFNASSTSADYTVWYEEYV